MFNSIQIGQFGICLEPNTHTHILILNEISSLLAVRYNRLIIMIQDNVCSICVLASSLVSLRVVLMDVLVYLASIRSNLLMRFLTYYVCDTNIPLDS